MRTWTSKVMLLAALVAIGCGDDDGTDGTADSGTPMDMMVTPDGSPDGGQPDMDTTDGDGNDSFADADPITLSEPVEGAAISPAGDQDFYSFTGEAGQWVVIATDANPDDDPEMLDTVVTLYDSSMTAIAENDDSVPRFDTDSEILTRLPSSGTYYVSVREFSDWAGETPEGMPSFTYSLTVADLDPAAPLVTIDAEPGDDIASAQALGLNTSAEGDFGVLLGGLRDTTDVDVFSFTVTAAKPYAEFLVLPNGAEGNGATAVPRNMWVTDAAGTTIIARVDPSMLPELSPALDPGEYRLWVEHGGAVGANDFYVIKVFRYTRDNTNETSEALNDVAATAEPLTLADADGDGIRTGFIRATLGPADVDHYSFDVAAGEVVSIFCSSRTAGSGVIGLSASLTDVTGVTVLGGDTETATESIVIEEVDVGGAGTYLLRLTKVEQDPEVIGDWARCGVAVGAPAP